MDEFVPLYAGSDEASDSLYEFLEERSIYSRKRTESKPIVSYKGMYESVALVEVFADDLDLATRALADWERPQAERAKALTRQIGVVLVGSVFLPAIWVLSHLIGIEGTPYPTPILVGALWLAGLLVAAQVESRRSRSEAIGPVA